MSEYQDYACGDEAFASWLQEVDAVCMERAGMGIFDFPDRLWRDDYDQALEPKTAFKLAVEEGLTR
jgi:hypothetical protein